MNTDHLTIKASQKLTRVQMPPDCSVRLTKISERCAQPKKGKKWDSVTMLDGANLSFFSARAH